MRLGKDVQTPQNFQIMLQDFSMCNWQAIMLYWHNSLFLKHNIFSFNADPLFYTYIHTHRLVPKLCLLTFTHIACFII